MTAPYPFEITSSITEGAGGERQKLKLELTDPAAATVPLYLIIKRPSVVFTDVPSEISIVDGESEAYTIGMNVVPTPSPDEDALGAAYVSSRGMLLIAPSSGSVSPGQTAIRGQSGIWQAGDAIFVAHANDEHGDEVGRFATPLEEVLLTHPRYWGQSSISVMLKPTGRSGTLDISLVDEDGTPSAKILYSGSHAGGTPSIALAPWSDVERSAYARPHLVATWRTARTQIELTEELVPIIKVDFIDDFPNYSLDYDHSFPESDNFFLREYESLNNPDSKDLDIS